jgi:HK97 family phage prohead protease
MEKRNLLLPGAELRSAADFAIEGKAVSYAQLSPDDQLGPGYRETVVPGAFTESIRAGGYQGDVHAFVNHDASLVLGRLKNGSLKLMDSKSALRFRIQLDKNNPRHVQTYQDVKTGLLDECSFSFVPQEQVWLDDVDTKGQPCKTRAIQKAHLIDVSIVSRPFYSLPGSTDAEARAAEARAALAKLETHGLSDAIAILRKAAKISARTLRAESDTSQVDFASHLQRCHEYGEFLESQLDQALNVSNSDDEDVDSVTRGAFMVARAACRIHNENCAQARLYHSKNQEAKKAKGKK